MNKPTYQDAMSSLARASIETTEVTFRHFPNLPTKLRLKILGLAARQPRDFEVRGIVVEADNTKYL